MVVMKTVTFKIEDGLLELLDKYAMKYKLDRSTAIRKAVEKLVKEEFEKENEEPIRVEKITLR